MKKLLVGGAVIFLSLCSTQTVFAAVSYSQSVSLAPGWNIVSTPRVLESHSFSLPETSENLSIYVLDASRPSGWATMAELGQTEFTPLYGYFINNKGTTTQTLTFNYKADTTPNERLFERSFATTGWYSFGVANPSYAKEQGSSTVDTDNPDHILNSLLGATSNYDSVVDFTDASYATDTDSVALVDPWKLKIRSADVSNTTEINSLNDFRETKGYAIYIKNATATLNGFQNADVPQCTDGVDNDDDGKTDYSEDFGCASLNDTNEDNVAAGTITLAKSSSYANQTITLPQTAYKIGAYQLTNGPTDTIDLNVFGLDFSSSSTTISGLSNIYVVYGSNTTEIEAGGTTTIYWAGTIGTLLPDETLNIAIYATLDNPISSEDVIRTSFAVAGLSHNSGDIVISEIVEGQTITVGSGSLGATLDGSTPISSLVVGTTMPKIASFKFTAVNDAYTITELTAKVASVDDVGAITELVFKDGATELKRQTFDGTFATATGLSVSLSSNSNKVIDVYANLASIGTGSGNTGANVGVTLTGYKALNSGGGESSYAVDLVGNNMYAYKTKPTITNVALPTSVLTAGTATVYKFTVTADAGGTLAWRKVSLNFATSTPSGAFRVTGWTIYDAANESTALANVTASSTTFANSTGRIDFLSSVDQEVSGSKTYVVKATVGGTPVTGSTASHSIASGASSHTAPSVYATVLATQFPTFIWSDESIAPHSATSADWNNDYLTKNVPTDSLTLTK
jgi:hypothetical protein